MISIITGVVIYPGLFLVADLQFLIGSIFGVLYSLGNRQPHQPFLKYGIIVGVGGGLFSSVILSLYETLLALMIGSGSIILFFLLLGVFLLSGIVIGLLTGAIISTIYIYKDMRDENKREENEHLDDDFFKDLID